MKITIEHYPDTVVMDVEEGNYFLYNGELYIRGQKSNSDDTCICYRIEAQRARRVNMASLCQVYSVTRIDIGGPDD